MIDPIEMTVAELTDEVAIQVMGWRKSYVMPSRNNDWLSCGNLGRLPCWRIGRHIVRFAADFKPATVAHHRDIVVDRMQHLGFICTLKLTDTWCATFCCRALGLRKSGIALNDKLGIAVMLAAYEADTGITVGLTDDQAN